MLLDASFVLFERCFLLLIFPFSFCCCYISACFWGQFPSVSLSYLSATQLLLFLVFVLRPLIVYKILVICYTLKTVEDFLFLTWKTWTTLMLLDASFVLFERCFLLLIFPFSFCCCYISACFCCNNFLILVFFSFEVVLVR
jgi:hypothetical protein